MMTVSKWLFWVLVALAVPTVLYILYLIGFAIFQLSDEIYYRRHHKKDSKEPEKDSDDCQNT